jgi:hypothetical protein
VTVGSGIAMALCGFLIDATSPRVAFLVAGAGGLLVTRLCDPGAAASAMIPTWTTSPDAC